MRVKDGSGLVDGRLIACFKGARLAYPLPPGN